MPRKAAIFTPDEIDVRRVRARVDSLVPIDFEWVFELHQEFQVGVRWKWKGLRNVPLWGGCGDPNVCILWDLVSGVNWSHEREAASNAVSEIEHRELARRQLERLVHAEREIVSRAPPALIKPKQSIDDLLCEAELQSLRALRVHT